MSAKCDDHVPDSAANIKNRKDECPDLLGEHVIRCRRYPDLVGGSQSTHVAILTSWGGKVQMLILTSWGIYVSLHQ